MIKKHIPEAWTFEKTCLVIIDSRSVVYVHHLAKRDLPVVIKRYRKPRGKKKCSG